MSDIFISYDSEDRERILPLFHALEKTGWSIFWDRTIPIGRTWPEFIGTEIETCRAMIVVWSQTSIKSDWVRDEAADAKERQVLFPVRVDDVVPPFGFRSIQTADLINWSEAAPFPAYDRLLQDLAALLGNMPAAEEQRRAEEEKAKEEQARREAAEAQRREEESRLEAEAERRREARRRAKETRKSKELAATRGPEDQDGERAEVELKRRSEERRTRQIDQEGPGVENAPEKVSAQSRETTSDSAATKLLGERRKATRAGLAVVSVLLVLGISLLFVFMRGGEEERKAKYLERAKSYLVEKNYDRAEIEFKNVLQIDHKNAEAFYHLGEIEERKQNWTQAFMRYHKASELDPEFIEPRVRLAHLYLVAKHSQEAQEQVKEILLRDAENGEGLTLQAMFWINDGEIDRAIEQLKRVLDKDPGLQSAALLLAHLYDQKGRVEDARSVLENAIANNEEPATLQLRLAEFNRKHQ